MKDLPHHMKKLNRRVIRSERKLGQEDADSAGITSSPRQHKLLKKQAKDQMRKEREERTPIKKTADERNREMKKRVPVFDRDSKQTPKEGARPSKKKKPRI